MVRNLRMMLFTLLLVFASTALAQNLRYSDQQTSVSLIPSYQSWTSEAGNDIEQSNLAANIFLPFTSNFSVNIATAYAQTGGARVDGIEGLSDTQIEAAWFLQALNLGLHFGIGLPTGRSELSGRSFLTAQQMSIDYLNLRTTSPGQGLTISPGFSLAIPISPTVAAGLGFAWQYNGDYRPLSEFELDYNPGNEFLLTGGMEIAFSLASILSIDGTYSYYQADRVNNSTLFQSGHKTIINAIFETSHRFDRAGLEASFRSRGKNKLSNIVANNELQEEDERSTPNLLYFAAFWQKRLGNGLETGPMVELRYYDETRSMTSVTEVGFGLAGNIRLNRTFQIPLHVKYYKGQVDGGVDFSGIDILFGISGSY